MSTPDPFQDFVDALRRTLTSTSTPTPPASTSAFPAASPSPPAIASPMAKPVPFSGSAEDCNGFLQQCSLVLEMQPHAYPDDKSKVAFIISQLDDKALRWAEPLWTQDNPVVQSLSSFTTHARKFLENLRGIHLLNPSCSKWLERTSPHNHVSSGFGSLCLHLAAYEDTIGLEKFIQLSIRFATRMQLCLEEHQDQWLFPSILRQPESVSQPDPANDFMQIERSCLSSAERQRRLTQSLCLYCGHPGHYIAECPIRPVRPMEPSNVPAVDYWFRESERVWDHLQLQRALRKRRITADLRRSQVPNYQPGQKVWLSTRDIRMRLPCRKLSPRFIGPFTIIRQINPVTYQLQLPPEYRIHPTFHVSLLKPHHPSVIPSTEPGDAEETPLPIIVDDGAAYLVKDILDSRRHGGHLEYLVDWDGYGPEERSWVPRVDILDPSLLDDFHARHSNRPAPRGRGRPP
ncbi:Retrotransposon Gag-like protein 3 [Anabarilius grahami]|uniref:Retrotransposon Gag-like protein 3 n=1 Tax=Anabarilius grahami TaxID=495550 RepID=A0A3N0Y8L4_ANAGA|nr:Retrotransposon Gag-like protein 3 [Anabarilius grahami]